jgi:3-oxoacyl-[acyl-carrier protein] reductase
MTTPSGRLAGRTALITGASRGIGAAVARRFAAEGCSVAIGHEPTEQMTGLAADVAAQIRQDGGTAVTVSADLADPEGPGRLVQAAREALGPLDILVANAAATGRAGWDEMTVQQWDHMQAVNVRGTWLLARAAKDDLVASGHGAIVTLTSVMAMTGQPGALHYTASKAAILGMTRALARDLGPSGVRVNAVMPGAIRTEHELELSPDADEVAARILPKQSLQRRGYAEDLAGAFVFLAGDDAAFVTGQVVCVDGGWVMY